MIGNNWGKNAWYFLHFSALNYNNINYKRVKYLDFYKNFINLIPCPVCKKHFTDNLNKLEYNLENNINGDKIFNWTVDLHNEVNRMNNKEIVSYEKARIMYSKQFDKRIVNKFVLQFIKYNSNKRNELNNFIKSISAIYPEKSKRVLMNKHIVAGNNNFKKTLYLFLVISGK